MRTYQAILAAGVLVATAAAAPTGYQGPSALNLILAIIPGATQCPAAKTQCRTAEQAAPFLVDAMAKWGPFTAWEVAAVLALTAHESAGLQSKQPDDPENQAPGKGTSNMQSAEYNLQFAKAVIAEKLPANPDPAAVLKLLQADEFNFQTGAWFLKTVCPQTIRDDLAAGKKAAFDNYMNKCVGVTAATDVQGYPKRLALWAKAMDAFALVYTD